MNRPDLRSRHLVALLAGVAAIGGSYFATGFTRRFVVAAVAGTVMQVLPGDVLAFGIRLVGDAAQPAFVVTMGGLTVFLFAGIVLAVLRLARSQDRLRAEAVFGVFAATTLVTFLLTITPTSALGAGVCAALVVAVAGRNVNRPSVSVARRGFLKAGAVAAAAVGLGVLANYHPSEPAQERTDDPQVRELLRLAADRSLDVPGVEGLVSDSFYTVDINSADPQVDPESWSLRITGAVEQEVELDYEDLRERPAEHRFVSLRCVGDPVNGHKLDTAVWTGVPVADLLAEAGAPDTCCVTLRSADDYYVSFPRAALEPGLLAHRMNGLPLPRAHGFPLRALVPGHWGETNGKWLTEIEVRDEPGQGYWEQRGWHGTGPVNTVAKLHGVEIGDQTVTVGGHAYAGTRGIQRVEVSDDGGATWNEAELSEPLPGAVPADGDTVDPSGDAADGWRMWRHEYEASAKHEAVVRAVDGTGTVQPKQEQKPFPRGATGWVRKTVRP